MEIHQSFDIPKNLQMFCLQNFYELFRRMEKLTYMDCNKVSNFPTNGRLKNVYIAKLHLCGMQWMLMTNKTCFSTNWIVTPIFKP